MNVDHIIYFIVPEKIERKNKMSKLSTLLHTKMQLNKITEESERIGINSNATSTIGCTTTRQCPKKKFDSLLKLYKNKNLERSCGSKVFQYNRKLPKLNTNKGNISTLMENKENICNNIFSSRHYKIDINRRFASNLRKAATHTNTLNTTGINGKAHIANTKEILSLPDDSNYERIVGFIKNLKGLMITPLEQNTMNFPLTSRNDQSINGGFTIKCNSKANLKSTKSVARRIKNKSMANTVSTINKKVTKSNKSFKNISNIKEYLHIQSTEEIMLFASLRANIIENRTKLSINEPLFIINNF